MKNTAYKLRCEQCCLIVCQTEKPRELNPHFNWWTINPLFWIIDFLAHIFLSECLDKRHYICEKCFFKILGEPL